MYSEITILVFSGRSAEPKSESVARMLADQFRVIEAEACEEGLVQLSNGVAAVVADLETGKAEAMELLRSGKQRKPDLPFLAVADGGDVSAAVEAMKLGAADCLVKPLDRNRLQEAVAQLIAGRGEDSTNGSGGGPAKHGSSIDIPPGTSLEDLERAAVQQALTQHQGNRTHAAKTLGISVRTLQRKLKAWGIPIVTNQNSSSSRNSFILPSAGGHGGHSAYSTHAG